MQASTTLTAELAALRQQFTTIATKEELAVEIIAERSVPPTPFSAALKDLAEALCHEHGYSWWPPQGGAGRDAQDLARVAPTAMLFVSAISGLSHGETEDAPGHLSQR